MSQMPPAAWLRFPSLARPGRTKTQAEDCLDWLEIHQEPVAAVRIDRRGHFTIRVCRLGQPPTEAIQATGPSVRG
jgi:hypothetical protein